MATLPVRSSWVWVMPGVDDADLDAARRRERAEPGGVPALGRVDVGVGDAAGLAGVVEAVQLGEARVVRRREQAHRLVDLGVLDVSRGGSSAAAAAAGSPEVATTRAPRPWIGAEARAGAAGLGPSLAPGWNSTMTVPAARGAEAGAARSSAAASRQEGSAKEGGHVHRERTDAQNLASCPTVKMRARSSATRDRGAAAAVTQRRIRARPGGRQRQFPGDRHAADDRDDPCLGVAHSNGTWNSRRVRRWTTTSITT